jgi:hypothetical protein
LKSVVIDSSDDEKESEMVDLATDDDVDFNQFVEILDEVVNEPDKKKKTR